MAKSRLAMVGCLTGAEQPWVRATGAEFAVKAFGVGQGDQVLVEAQTGEGETIQIPLSNGVTPLDPSRWEKYRVTKIAGSSPQPTTVQIQCR